MSSFGGSCRVAGSPDNWDPDSGNGGRVHDTNSSVTSRFNTTSDPDIPSTATGISVSAEFSMVAADTDGGATCFLELLDNSGSTIGSSNPGIPEGTPSDFNDFRQFLVTANSLTNTQVSALKLQATNGTTGGDPNRRIRWDTLGDNLFTVSFTLAAPTQVVTDPATSITASQAQLNARINPNGANSSWPDYYNFEWGLTTAYGNSTTVIPITGSVQTAVLETITGLAANTTYHFRIKAYNNDQVVYGSDASFMTGANYSVTLSETIVQSDTLSEVSSGVLSVVEEIPLTDTVTLLPALVGMIAELDLTFPTEVNFDAIF